MNMTSPSQRSIENIYGRILEAVFNPKKYSQDVVNMKGTLVDTTITVWEEVKRKLLPTPAKFHYVFTMRELSRVFQGIFTVANKPEYDVIKDCSKMKNKIGSQLFIVALWRHECVRVFEDKLINIKDKKTFHDVLDRVTKEKFKDALGYDEDQLMFEELFCDF